MVHISDGVLSPPVLAVGWAITLILIAVAFWWSKRKGSIAEEIPKLSVMTAAFFVASLFHITVGPTSVHFILNGLVGIILGILAYPAIFIGLVLQAFLFQHGGVTTIGINTVNMGVPALIAYGLFKGGSKLGFSRKSVSEGVFGAIAGGLAVALAVLFLVICLLTTGREFLGVASFVTMAHIPIIIIEAAVAGSVVTLLMKAKPELIPLEEGGERK